MALHSIEYLNARREAKAATGGKRYVVKRNNADDKAQLRALDTFEIIQGEIQDTLTDLDRAIAAFRNRTAQFATLAHSESFADLEF